MEVIVTSTTDTPEQVQAASGLKTEKVEAKQSPAPEIKQVETPDASGALENEDSHDADESETHESENADESEEKEERPKKKNGFKKRIDKLNKRVTEKQSEIEYWRSEALKNQKPITPEKSQPKLEQSGKPLSAQFDSHEEYIEALTDWKVEQKEVQREAKKKETEIKTSVESQRQKYFERAKEFAKTQSDYQEVVADVDDIPMSLAVQQLLLESDNGPELAYQLAQDRDEYKRICSLSPMAAAREVGKLEAKLSSAEPSKQEPRTTKAPKPISRVQAKSSLATDDPWERPYDEWAKWREQQLKKR